MEDLTRRAVRAINNLSGRVGTPTEAKIEDNINLICRHPLLARWILFIISEGRRVHYNPSHSDSTHLTFPDIVDHIYEKVKEIEKYLPSFVLRSGILYMGDISACYVDYLIEQL